MKILTSESGGTTIIAVEGEIDITSSPDLHKTFEKLVKQNVTKFIVDLKLTSYMDSSGLATLVFLFQTLKDKQGKVVLANIPSDKVRAIFEITRLDKLFEIYNSREEALAAF